MTLGQGSRVSARESGGDPDPVSVRDTAGEELEGLYRFAVARLAGKSELAEDVVQQALLIALTHESVPEEACRQRAWLRGIVHNVIRRQFRSLRRGREAMDRLAGRQGEGAFVCAGSDGAEHERRSDRVRLLFLGVTQLSQADQDLFYAVYRAGRSHACVARELGTTVKGVEARLYRMRTRLRRVLESSEEATA